MSLDKTMLKLSEQLKVLPEDQYKAVVREDRDDGEWMSPELLPGSKFEVTHLEWDAETH